MMTHGQTLMLWSWGQMAQGPALSLHDEAANSLPHIPRHAVPHMLGSPMDHMPLLEVAVAGADAVEVRVDEVELDNL